MALRTWEESLMTWTGHRLSAQTHVGVTTTCIVYSLPVPWHWGDLGAYWKGRSAGPASDFINPPCVVAVSAGGCHALEKLLLSSFSLLHQNDGPGLSLSFSLGILLQRHSVMENEPRTR